MTQASNQFGMTVEKGMITGSPAWNTLNCVVAAAESGTLVAGQTVIIDDVAGAQIPVEAAAATGNAIFGVIAYNIKKNEYVAGDQIKIAKSGDIVYMEASAAIARGATVEAVITGAKVKTVDAGTAIGTALDKAAADGDLVRVLLTV